MDHMLLSIALETRFLTLWLPNRLSSSIRALDWFFLLSNTSLNLVSGFRRPDTLISLEDDFFGRNKVTLPVPRFAFALGSDAPLSIASFYSILILSDGLICVVVWVCSLILLLLNFGFQNHREVVVSDSAGTHSRLLHVWVYARVRLPYAAKKRITKNLTYFYWLSHLPI
jgi:hypothetical protein